MGRQPSPNGPSSCDRAIDRSEAHILNGSLTLPQTATQSTLEAHHKSDAAAVTSKAASGPSTAPKRVAQSDIPQVSLGRALAVAQKLWDEFAGGPIEPHQLAIALGISPTSSAWRALSGSAVAYGLVAGAYNVSTAQLHGK